MKEEAARKRSPFLLSGEVQLERGAIVVQRRSGAKTSDGCKDLFEFRIVAQGRLQAVESEEIVVLVGGLGHTIAHDHPTIAFLQRDVFGCIDSIAQQSHW